MIYLDNSATTQIDPRVLEAMLPYLQEEYGNPSAKFYTLAENAKKAVEESRQNLARLINADLDEVIFTSGASESNNFVIKGIADLYHEKGNHIITTAIEHKSVNQTCQYLETKGYQVTYLPVDKYGQVDPAELSKAITSGTILVSIMWGNNEIGTLNRMKELGEICKSAGVFFHSDATQVLGKVKIDVKAVNIDFISFSAHKLHGPKGIGACFIRKDDLGLKRKITPLIHGGGQEFDYRAGTLCTHNIVGFGKATEIAYHEMNEYVAHIWRVEKEFKAYLAEKIPGVKFNGHPVEKIPGIVNVTFPGITNELLIKKLADSVAISTGSACSLNKPSKVLQAIGVDVDSIRNSVRISIGRYNSDLREIVEMIEKVAG